MRPDAGTTLPITVEFDEVDSYGMVHHSRYLVYAERARLRFLASCGLLDGGDIHLVVHTFRARYRTPARLMDTLTVTAEPASWTDYAISFRHRICRDHVLLAALTVELASVAPGSGKPVPLPEPLVHRLQASEWSNR